METKNYILITVVILAFALISINLNDFTGSIISDKSIAIIKVSPSSIKAGEKITIEVTPGSAGVKNEIKIYKECNSMLRENCEGSRIAILHLCSGTSYTKNCKDPVEKIYKTSAGLGNGLYYIKITEYAQDENGKYIERKVYFRIE